MTELSGIASRARLLLDAPGYAQGWQELVTIQAPAAGAGWSHQVDGRWSERLITVTWSLTTDAVVANRLPRLNLLDNNGQLVTSAQAAGTVLASTTVQMFLWSLAPVLSQNAAGTTRGYFPDILVPPGWTWQSSGTGYDAGDQETSAVLLVHRFPSDTTTIDAAAG